MAKESSNIVMVVLSYISKGNLAKVRVFHVSPNCKQNKWMLLEIKGYHVSSDKGRNFTNGWPS